MGTAAITPRLLSALLLAPLCVAAVLQLSTAQLAIVFALVALPAAWEWAALAGVHSLLMRTVYSTLLLILLALVYFAVDVQLHLLIASLAWWVFAFCFVLGARRRLGTVAALIAGVCCIVPAWLAAVVVHRSAGDGALLLLLLFVLVWLADAAAWGVGKCIGRTPLAPTLSPAKTREGALGALVAVLVMALAVWAWVPVTLSLPLWAWLAVCITCALAAVAGDLLESAFKRAAGVKDSGVLIPGHGGVLDRVDSFLAAAPFYAVAMRAAWSW